MIDQQKNYITFWSELKTPLIESIDLAFYTQILKTTQRQAAIKIIEKKDRDKQHIKKETNFIIKD